MSATDHARFPQADPDCFPGISWNDHLRFCGDDELRDGLFGLGNQFMDQPDLTSPADGPDFSLLHDASPTSPSVQLQPCFDMPAAGGPSALTQGLREWGNSAVNPAVVSPTMDLLSEELIGSCNMADSEPFNPLFLAEGANFTPADNTPSECSSFNSSVGSIPIPQPNQQAFSEYSFCSEPSLGYTGSSFNSDRSFDTLYSAHKQNERLAPPPNNTLALHNQPQVSSWQQQQTKPIHFQRARRLTADQPKRGPPASSGSGVQKNTLSFIHCRPSEDSRRILTYGAEHSPNGKRPRGRKNPLTPEQKKHAALMRRVKACESCRLRKEKCDPGIPCRACVEHFRTDLVRTPCRGKTLEDLTSSMLPDELGWCPTERTLDTYFGPGAYTISSEVSFVNLTLGFGPPLLMQVRRVIPTHPNQLIHSHIVYDWPAPCGGETMLSSSPHQYWHSVLPAILADTSDVREELNEHLSILVNDEQSFRQFPLYNSKLEVLKHVYMFFLGLNDPAHSHLLRTALKLLVLVHIGDHTMLDTSAPLFFTFSRNVSDAHSMTPCLIRGQLGAVIPTLAQDLLREALSRLESICLARRCTDWPIALATLATVCMAVESVQYHAAKEPYHAHFNVAPSCNKSSGINTLSRPAALTIPQSPRVVVFGPERPPSTSSAPSSFTTISSSSPSIHEDFVTDDFSDSDAASPLSATHEESVDRLIKFYRHCFRGCHCSRLQDFVPATSASTSRRQQQEESQDAVSTRFVNGVKVSLRNARAYLMQRRVVDGSVLRAISGKKEAGVGNGGDGGRQEGKLRDMSVFFDRLLAKLFLD